MYGHHPYQCRTFLSPPQRDLLSISNHSPFLASPPSPRQPLIYFLCQWICLFWTIHVSGMILYVTLCDWLLSLSMFSRFIHAVACSDTSFLLIAVYYSIVWIHHFLFIHSSADGQLGCFHFLTSMNNTAMNICVEQVFV